MDGIDLKGNRHLLEYEKLKEEQTRRIEFRDNTRYFTIAAIGLVAAHAVDSSYQLWLAIPWICTILGWNCVANAYKVREIRSYLLPVMGFPWERMQPRRRRLIVIDELTFVAPSVVALALFAFAKNIDGRLWLLVAIEGVLTIWISCEIPKSADVHPLCDTKVLLGRILRGAGALIARSDNDDERARQPIVARVPALAAR
jgi:hypothetical protein